MTERRGVAPRNQTQSGASTASQKPALRPSGKIYAISGERFNVQLNADVEGNVDSIGVMSYGNKIEPSQFITLNQEDVAELIDLLAKVKAALPEIKNDAQR